MGAPISFFCLLITSDLFAFSENYKTVGEGGALEILNKRKILFKELHIL